MSNQHLIGGGPSTDAKNEECLEKWRKLELLAPATTSFTNLNARVDDDDNSGNLLPQYACLFVKDIGTGDDGVPKMSYAYDGTDGLTRVLRREGIDYPIISENQYSYELITMINNFAANPELIGILMILLEDTELHNDVRRFVAYLADTRPGATLDIGSVTNNNNIIRNFAKLLPGTLGTPLNSISFLPLPPGINATSGSKEDFISAMSKPTLSNIMREFADAALGSATRASQPDPTTPLMEELYVTDDNHAVVRKRDSDGFMRLYRVVNGKVLEKHIQERDALNDPNKMLGLPLIGQQHTILSSGARSTLAQDLIECLSKSENQHDDPSLEQCINVLKHQPKTEAIKEIRKIHPAVLAGFLVRLGFHRREKNGIITVESAEEWRDSLKERYDLDKSAVNDTLAQFLEAVSKFVNDNPAILNKNYVGSPGAIESKPEWMFLEENLGAPCEGAEKAAGPAGIAALIHTAEVNNRLNTSPLGLGSLVLAGGFDEQEGGNLSYQKDLDATLDTAELYRSIYNTLITDLKATGTSIDDATIQSIQDKIKQISKYSNEVVRFLGALGAYVALYNVSGGDDGVVNQKTLEKLVDAKVKSIKALGTRQIDFISFIDEVRERCGLNKSSKPDTAGQLGAVFRS